jgi:hypothetical protein
MAGSEVIMTFQRQALNLAAGGPQCALHSLSLNHEMRKIISPMSDEKGNWPFTDVCDRACGRFVSGNWRVQGSADAPEARKPDQNRTRLEVEDLIGLARTAHLRFRIAPD